MISHKSTRSISLKKTDCSYTEDRNISKDIESSKDPPLPSGEETNFTNIPITRRILRGRKEKIPFPKNKPKCEICLQFFEPKEELISCITCKCIFHKSCFDKYESYDNSSYRCIRCEYAVKLNKSINDFKCFICNSSKGVIDIDINYIDGPFYHKVCLDFLIEFKGLKRSEILKENIRKWRFKNSCRYCGEKLSKNKAVIKCKNPKCKEYYHIPCAIEKGIIFDLNYMKHFYCVKNNYEIPFYCSNHNKKISYSYKKYIMNTNINQNNDFTLEKSAQKEILKENNQENFQYNNENEIYMNIDDEFENNKNNPFNLDFETINIENDDCKYYYNMENDEPIINNSISNNYYSNEYFRLNSKFSNLFNNNDDDNSLTSI